MIRTVRGVGYMYVPTGELTGLAAGDLFPSCNSAGRCAAAAPILGGDTDGSRPVSAKPSRWPGDRRTSIAGAAGQRDAPAAGARQHDRARLRQERAGRYMFVNREFERASGRARGRDPRAHGRGDLRAGPGRAVPAQRPARAARGARRSSSRRSPTSARAAHVPRVEVSAVRRRRRRPTRSAAWRPTSRTASGSRRR